MGAGIAWFTYLGTRGSQNMLSLRLSISSILINTEDVTGINQLSISLTNRSFSLTYQVQTSYSVTGSTFTYDIGEAS